MESNMQYRQYLTQNGINIIKENFKQYNADCGNFSYKKNTVFTPVLMKNVTDCPLPYDSDLKQNYLNKYLFLSNQYSSGIMIKK